MGPRIRRVSVRTYNLRPGDVYVANPTFIVESAVHYPGTVLSAFVDIAYTNGRRYNGANPDAMVTVIRTYA